MTNRGIKLASGELAVVPCGSAQFRALRYTVSCRGYQIESVRARQRLELPTGAVTMVFGFGQPVRLTGTTDGGRGVTMTSLVSGVRSAATIGEHCGRVSGVELSLPPPMAYAVVGAAMNEIADAFVDPVDVFGPAAESLGERLAHCPDWPARFSVIDRLLAERLSRETRCRPEVAWVWRQLQRGSAATVGEILAETGWSRRRMERRFRECIGQSPKAVAQIARLQRALRLLDTRIPLAEVAVRSGFHDQAHLDRTFKDRTGRTPSRLRVERIRDAAAVQSDRLPGLVTSVVLSR